MILSISVGDLVVLVRMAIRRIIGRKNAGNNDHKKDNREKRCW